MYHIPFNLSFIIINVINVKVPQYSTYLQPNANKNGQVKEQ